MGVDLPFNLETILAQSVVLIDALAVVIILFGTPWDWSFQGHAHRFFIGFNWSNLANSVAKDWIRLTDVGT